jgi:Holliday junction DNA helicase RuvB
MSNFHGQTIIINEINLMLDAMIEEGENYNILLRAPSGHGKTTLALYCMSALGVENCAYYLPNNEGNNLSPLFNDRKRIHTIDETHELKNPEFLYPLLDSGEYSFFILSNESGTLKEPLRNRCIPFIFHPYSIEEISQIIIGSLENFTIPEEFTIEIANRSRGNPRIAKKICERLGYVFRFYDIPESLESLKTILEDVLYIKEKGLTRFDEIYLEYLGKVGGRASLISLISGTGIDRTTILTEVEPLLLYQGFVEITSRGRILVENRSAQHA